MNRNMLTESDRLKDLKRRGDLIKESFAKEFNKIRRVGLINEGNEKDYTEQVTLDNGVEYTVYIHPFRMWTSDTIDRYSIYVKNNNLTKNDVMTLFSLVANNDPTLTVGKINKHGGMQTEIIVWSTDENIHHRL